jgi:multimeric flavodoxin WrbA
MSALQRIGYVSRNSDRFLAGKVGGAIAVARRGGQTLTLQEMLMFFCQTTWWCQDPFTRTSRLAGCLEKY